MKRIDERAPFFDGDENETTDPQGFTVVPTGAPGELVGVCSRPGCCVVRHDLAQVKQESRLWRAIAFLAAGVLTALGLSITLPGCSAAQGAAFRSTLARCEAQAAPAALAEVQSALGEAEWRAAVGGVAARVGLDQARCLVEAALASWSVPASESVASSPHALLAGCPTGSCDGVFLRGPEAGAPLGTLRHRGETWLAEHRQ